jgi:hypothetical protein
MAQTRLHGPYIGLKPYTEDDAAYFFGREKDTRLIVANLFAARFTLVYGASGVGKSSVLRAGVLHNLRSREDISAVVFNEWQSEPISGIKELLGETVKKMIGRAVELSSSATLAEYLSACTTLLNRRLMLILDQFEEYFLYYPQDDTPTSFATQFPAVVTQNDLPISLLVSLREDSLARMDRFEGSIPNLFDNFLRLDHLDRNGAIDAIKKPLEQYNRHYAEQGQEINIDQTVVDGVIEQVKRGEVLIGEYGHGKVSSERESDIHVETPYLQLVMTRLWDEEMKAGSHTFRLGTLERLGGAKSIVRTHLDGVMGTLSSSEQEMAATVFRYLVTPSGAKIAYDVLDLAELAKVEVEKLAPLLDKLTGSEFRVLRPLESPKSIQESALAFSVAYGRTHIHQTTLAKLRTRRYEIFHDVLAPAILDWRARYLQSQEQAKKEEQFVRQLRGAKTQRWVWAVAAFVIGVVFAVLSYRYNWFGARSVYLAWKADKMDVITWLVEQKVGENIVLDNISAEGTRRALVALRLAHELDPNNPKTIEYLGGFLRDSRRLTRTQSASLELLQNNMMILREINKEVPHEPIEKEVDSLNIRIKRMINERAAMELLTKLKQQTQDSTVGDPILLSGYQSLLYNYHDYVDTVMIQRRINDFQNSINRFERQLIIQKSDTATILQKLNSWQNFVAQQRQSPEKNRGIQEIQQLKNLIDNYASILKSDDFVTCRNVVNLIPQDTSSSFLPGNVCAWARISTPRSEKIVFKWYTEGSMFYTSSFTVPPSSSYRLYASKNYGSDTQGLNEVRAYNSQNILIGRRVFRIR